MRFIELNPQWVDAGGEGISDSEGNPVPERNGVGIIFDCPCGCSIKCYVGLTNPLDGKPYINQRPLWNREGEDFNTISLKPSIRRLTGCKWHGFITNGEVITV